MVDFDILNEAYRLRKLAEDHLEKLGASEEDWAVILLSPLTKALLWKQEADALERGYSLGRTKAAFDVRVGLDQRHTNGSVRFDSDVESPPGWLMRKAERLARGDA